MPVAKASWGPEQALDLEVFLCFDVQVSHPVSDTQGLSSLSFRVKRGLQMLLMLLVPMRHLIREGLERWDCPGAGAGSSHGSETHLLTLTQLRPVGSAGLGVTLGTRVFLVPS